MIRFSFQAFTFPFHIFLPDTGPALKQARSGLYGKQTHKGEGRMSQVGAVRLDNSRVVDCSPHVLDNYSVYVAFQLGGGLMLNVFEFA